MGTELKYASEKKIADFQSEALSRVSDSLDEWQRPSCYHSDGNCKCKHRNDFYESQVHSVKDWLEFLTTEEHGKFGYESKDPCFDIRSDFTQYHPVQELMADCKEQEWIEDRLPITKDGSTATGFQEKSGSFLALRCIWNAEAVGKIIQKAKKTVTECEKENGYYLYSERLMFKLVADHDDIHLVIWFNYW